MTGHRIEVLFSDECRHAREAIAGVKRIAADLMPGVGITQVKIPDMVTAVSNGLTGSPSIRVDGVDIQGIVGGEPSLSCRLYPGSGPLPPEWMIEAGMLRALKPAHLLFMCVANSSRSQMAEGIARSMAPAGVKVSSAGSHPAHVSPVAKQVLGEIGIDISGQRSKGIDGIDLGSVSAIITLCSDEACLSAPNSVPRVRWRLPDPSRVRDGGAGSLELFRGLRDELRKRLGILFSGWKI